MEEEGFYFSFGDFIIIILCYSTIIVLLMILMWLVSQGFKKWISWRDVLMSFLPILIYALLESFMSRQKFNFINVVLVLFLINAIALGFFARGKIKSGRIIQWIAVPAAIILWWLIPGVNLRLF
jgi:hypothetical protein